MANTFALGYDFQLQIARAPGPDGTYSETDNCFPRLGYQHIWGVHRRAEKQCDGRET
jgi:hypothetical protein